MNRYERNSWSREYSISTKEVRSLVESRELEKEGKEREREEKEKKRNEETVRGEKRGSGWNVREETGVGQEKNIGMDGKDVSQALKKRAKQTWREPCLRKMKKKESEF